MGERGRRIVLALVSRKEVSVSMTSIVQRARMARESVSRFNGGRTVVLGREEERFQDPEGRDINNWVSGFENCIKETSFVIV